MGNGGHVAGIKKWLADWERTFGHGAPPPARGAPKDGPKRAILISGPPGIGKTSTALIACRESGYAAVEVNASDTRNKAEREIKGGVGGRKANMVKEMVDNAALSFGGAGARRQALIMDEVDGMSGGDRGGVADLIESIKHTRIPIICICNDRYSPKLKSLLNHVAEFRFARPTKQQISARMARVAAAEGLQLSAAALEQLAEGCNSDLRLVLNSLQMLRTRGAAVTFDQARPGGPRPHAAGRMLT